MPETAGQDGLLPSMMPLLRRAVRRTSRSDRREPTGDRFFFDPILASDTYLVSFPRSGNTYLRHLITALIVDGQPTAADVAVVVPDVHRTPLEVGRPAPTPLVVKSHAPPADVAAKVIYLVRDPRAALLSYRRYLIQRGQPVPTGADAMLGWTDVWPCPWPEHVAGWLRMLDSRVDGALLVRYEDLTAEPARVLAAVAALAGLPVPPGAVDRAVARSTVEAMRAAERDGKDGSLNFVGTTIGDWPAEFSRDALVRFEATCPDLLTRLGYPATSVD